MMKKYLKVFAARRLVISSGALIITLAVGVGWRLAGAAGNPVPAAIRGATGFNIYYPDPRRLPAGYTLDTSSFQKAPGGAVIYIIRHASGGNLIVSEAARPGGNVIDDFTKNSIPLHTTVSTGLGSAQIGAYGHPPNQRSIVSLAVNNGPWLIITAPPDIAQATLKQVAASFRQ